MIDRKLVFIFGFACAAVFLTMNSHLLSAETSSFDTVKVDFSAETNSSVHYPETKHGPPMTLYDFDINKVDFTDPVAMRYASNLSEYFICRAAQRDSINQCNAATFSSTVINECQRYFNEYQAFYGRLFKNGRVSPGILTACYTIGGKFDDENTCKSYANALLTADESFCSKFDDSRLEAGCRALVSGQPSQNAGKAAYISALRLKDINKCEQLIDSKDRAACVGALSDDEKVCENNAGFKLFKQKYCERE